MRSSAARRMSVRLAATGDGASCSSLSLARMKGSIALRGRAWPSARPGGRAGRLGGMKAQCFCHSAPCSIQRRIDSFSAPVSKRPMSDGGMTSSGLSVVMRRYASLPPGLPATNGRTPSSLRNAPSSVSSRRPALRWLASGPWHWKQLSERIGRMSRLNSMLLPSSATTGERRLASRIATVSVRWVGWLRCRITGPRYWGWWRPA